MIQLHWESRRRRHFDQLPDLVKAAHAAGRRPALALRLVRAGDPFDGELYIVVDVFGPPEARYAVSARSAEAARGEAFGSGRGREAPVIVLILASVMSVFDVRHDGPRASPARQACQPTLDARRRDYASQLTTC